MQHKCHMSENTGPNSVFVPCDRSCGVSGPELYMAGSFCSYRSKIQIQMDLLLSASAHTWLPDLGVSHTAEAGFGPTIGFTSSLSRFVV